MRTSGLLSEADVGPFCMNFPSSPRSFGKLKVEPAIGNCLDLHATFGEILRSVRYNLVEAGSGSGALGSDVAAQRGIWTGQLG